MSAATTALIAHLAEKVALITNDTDRLDCACWLEEYAVALPAAQGSMASNILSYSMSGRNIQYRSLDEFARHVQGLRAKIDAALYGRGGYIDNRLDVEVGVIHA